MLKIQTIELDDDPMSKALVSAAYGSGIPLSEIAFEMTSTGEYELWHNGLFVVIKSGSQSALCVCDYDAGVLRAIPSKELDFKGVKPRDAAQTCMMYAMKKAPLSVAIGVAGSGKTTLALAYAIYATAKQYKKIVLCKPTTFVGMRSNAIAPIPGDHREKIAGYIDSYLYVFKKLLGEDAEMFMREWEDNGRLVFKPLELIRGLNLDDSVVIIDEAQNTTPHELLSLISRVSDTSRLIVMGDPLQIDTDMRFEETGLGALVNSESFLTSPYSMGIQLESQYRGKLAQLAFEILTEIHVSRENERDDYEEYKQDTKIVLDK